jgi:hypothetical protein
MEHKKIINTFATYLDPQAGAQGKMVASGRALRMLQWQEAYIFK